MSSLESANYVDDTPSNAQLSLALAIVKLKPSNTTIKEHILEVRDHIREGRREQDGNGPNSYLDSVAFWQQAYEKSELAQSQLLDKIYELERRNDALMDRMRSNGMEAVPPSPKSFLKRKTKGQSEDSKIENSRKRTKGAAMGNSGNAGTGAKESSLQDIVAGFDYLEGNMAPFLRQFYWLQQLLQKKLNIRRVSLAAVELCKSGAGVLSSALEPKQKPASSRAAHKTTLKPDEPDVISVLNAIERSYPCLIHGLKKVSTADDGKSHAGLILYHIILLFEAILGGLRHHSIKIAKESIARAKQSKKAKGRAKTNRTRTAQVNTATEDIEEARIPGRLAHLLQAMILSLDPSIREQCSLLEGFLFLLLDRVGKMLCFFVLGDLQSDRQLRLDPSELPIPGGLSEMQDGEITRKGAEREAKHLIGILEKTLAFIDHNKERMAAMPIFNSPISDEPGTHSVPSITERVRTKLQNTLLKAVFGDQDVCFKDCLPSPEIPDPALAHAEQDITPLETENTHEWFTREVWRLLGWDILARA